MIGMVRSIAVFGLALAVAAPAQAQAIEGAWITEFDRMMRNEGGTVSTGDKTRAKMSLQRKGDSVTGTWEVISPSSTPAVARQLRGTIAGNKVSLTTQFEARVNLNGEESARKITVVYDLTLNGDKLEGTMTNKGPNGDMPARPFSAWRETSK